MKLLQILCIMGMLSFGNAVGSDQDNQLIIFDRTQHQEDKVCLKSLQKSVTTRDLDHQSQELHIISCLVSIYKQELQAPVYHAMPSFKHSKKIIIDSVENRTPYPLIVTNRYSDASFPILETGDKVYPNYEVENYANISDEENFKRDAQFVIKAVNTNNPYLEKQSYLNMAIFLSKRKQIFKFTGKEQDSMTSEFTLKLRGNGSKNVHARIIFSILDQSLFRSFLQEYNRPILSHAFDSISCFDSNFKEK